MVKNSGIVDLYYWHRRKVGGEAEIDYVIQDNEHIATLRCCANLFTKTVARI